MKIVGLEVSNIKRVNLVHVKPDGNTVIIAGANEQGKSSLLDAIEMAIGGGVMPTKPVRDGENEGSVKIDLGDIIVYKTFSSDGRCALRVTAKDGTAMRSPQKVMDGFVGKLTFDPLVFSRQKPVEQLATLKSLVGIDFTKLDQDRQKIYGERTSVNRERNSAIANRDKCVRHPDAPAEETSAQALLDELRAINEHNKEAQRREDALAGVRTAQRGVLKEIADLEAKLAAKRAESEALAAQELEATAALMERKDDAAIAQRISKIDEVNGAVRENARWKELDGQASLLTRKSDALTKAIEKIDAEKVRAVQDANLPIPGLALGDGYVELDGIPFDQCSSAKKLRTSIAMGIALNPKLRVMLIRDGAFLDEGSMKLVAEMADEHDMQVWIERVGDDKNATVIIEDGMAKAS